MSDELDLPIVYMAPITIGLCDFCLGFHLVSLGIILKRTEMNGGCVVYTVGTKELTYGRIFLKEAFIERHTLLRLLPDDKEAVLVAHFTNILTIILGSFWKFCENERRAECDVPPIGSIPAGDGKTIADHIAALPQQAIEEPKNPQPGDPITAWLDWREKQRKRKQRLTLEEIAAQSGHSISTLKKHSAQRKPRGTK